MSEKSIIVFDGLCHLCSGSAQFIIKRDPHFKFLFASLQSNPAHHLIRLFDAKGVGDESFLLIKNGECFYQSDAVIEIAKDLSGIFSLFRFFGILPKPFRDYLYLKVARNRYRLFGQKDLCMFPSTNVRKRFLV